MKHIVLTSGGVGSAVALHWVVSTYGAENTISLFADTMMEDEDLYRFLNDVHAKLGVPITRIADGRDPFQVSDDRNFMANSRRDVCSEMLKRKPMDRWIKKHFKPTECTCYIGIDASEEHRLTRLAPRKHPYIYRAPLVELGIWMTPDYKAKWCAYLGIELPRLYKLGFPHNNCGGFCVKAGLGQFKMLWEKMPLRYLENEKKEQDLYARKPNLRPFLRKRIKGVDYYMTMQEYRTAYLMPWSTGKLDIDDEIDLGGCGCAIE